MTPVQPSEFARVQGLNKRAQYSRTSKSGWVFASAVVLTALAFFIKQMFFSSAVDIEGIAFNSMQWHARLRGAPAGVSSDEIQRQLQQRLDALDAILSTWRTDSELTHLNHASIGTAVTVSDVLFDAIDKANRVSAITGGAYDITVAPLVNLWGFGPRSSSEIIPDGDAIRTAQQHVGWQQLVLNRDHKTITRLTDVEIDLSSVGEGVACDELARLLAQLGVDDYTISVAGAVRAQGLRADGTAWEIAVEKPDASGAAQLVLDITDIAVASAGSYRNYREQDGKRYSHIIDARTGRPITHNGVQVTVITSGVAMDTAYADALDTALEVLGPVEGFALAEQHGIAALFIEKTAQGFVEHPTSTFVALVSKNLIKNK